MTEQRWNARQFAKSVRATGRLGYKPSRLVWVTTDALKRIESALTHGTLDLSAAPPLPEDMDIMMGIEQALSPSLAVGVTGELENHRNFLLVYGADPRHRVDTLIFASGFTEDSIQAYLLRRKDFHGITLSIEDARRDAPSYNMAVAFGDGAQHLVDVFRATWALLNEPVEREVSATTLSQSPIRTGKGRRARDVNVSVIDVRRSTTTRSAPSGRVVEHDHRWERIGHWRMQPFGKGRTERRRIWIDPVVCGPPDKPLIVRPKVSVLR